MTTPIQNDLRDMIPTYKECIRMGRLFAKGYKWPIDEVLDIDGCSICGKRSDLVCGFTSLIPIFNGESILHICDTHRKEKGEFVWNCLTGEKVYLVDRFVLKDIFQQIILKAYIFFRSVYFIIEQLLGWKVLFPIRLKLKQLKRL